MNRISHVFLLFFLCLSCLPAKAQENRRNWMPLTVTAEEEESSVPAAPESSPAEHSGRFTSLFDSLQKNLRDRERERKREVKAVSREDVYSAIEEMIQKAYPGGVQQMLAVNEQIEDDMYDLIVSMPPYTYQYFAPFLHTLPYMPERIMNIPGIKELKGKFPTRIAPQMKEYAEKYGKDMSPHLYVYLMPEAWPSQEREKETFKGYNKIITIDEDTKPEDLFIINRASVLNEHEMPSPERYRSGAFEQRVVRPQTPADQVTETSALTEGDIEAVLSSIDAVKQAFGENRLDGFHSQIRGMSISDDNLMGELLNPMQTLVDKIKRLPESAKFAETVGRYGFTPDTWALTTDKIIKAARVARMSPGTALTLRTWRGLKTPPASFDILSPRNRQTAWDSIQLYLGLYSTTKENLLAVRNYRDNIRDAFAAQDMTFMEAPVFGIY